MQSYRLALTEICKICNWMVHWLQWGCHDNLSLVYKGEGKNMSHKSPSVPSTMNTNPFKTCNGVTVSLGVILCLCGLFHQLLNFNDKIYFWCELANITTQVIGLRWQGRKRESNRCFPSVSMMPASPRVAEQVASDLAQKGKHSLGAAPKNLVLFRLAFCMAELDEFLPLKDKWPI